MQGCIPGPIPEGLNIFETMRAEADGRILLWALHLDRLRRGCAAVGFHLDEMLVEAALSDLPRGRVLRARLAIDAGGHVTLIHTPLPPNPPVWSVTVSPLRLQADDPWLRIKSTRRPVYDAARAALAGADEAVLLNERGEVCEGTITNVFLPRDGILLTPPLSAGLLPGVLRRRLLQDGLAREETLWPRDLDTAFFCGNALRGLVPARLS